MATRETKIAAIFSEGKSAWVYDESDTEWLQIPGDLDWTEDDGSRDGRSTGTDSTRPHGVASNLKAPTVTISTKFVQAPAWTLIDNALMDKTPLSFRLDTEGETVYSAVAAGVTGMTCAIAQDGTCTFVNGSSLTIDDFPIGACIKIAGTLYPLKSVTTTGQTLDAVKVEAITSAVSAAAFTVETPGERVSFRGKVLSAPTRQHTLAQQSEREGTLVVQSLSVLPKPVRIA